MTTPRISLAPALRIAVEIHGEQVDKAGEPYLLHLFRVALAMDSDQERVVALLHDALEDCENSCETMADIHEDYGQDVLDAVQSLTRWERESYMDYIRRLAANPLAVKVKFADIQDNRNPSRLRKLPRAECDRLYDKYEQAWLTLYAAADAAGTLPTEVICQP